MAIRAPDGANKILCSVLYKLGEHLSENKMEGFPGHPDTLKDQPVFISCQSYYLEPLLSTYHFLLRPKDVRVIFFVFRHTLRYS